MICRLASLWRKTFMNRSFGANHNNFASSLQYSSSCLKKQKHPRLFLIQPRLHPVKYMQAKLNEALYLANSLAYDKRRDRYSQYHHFSLVHGHLPPHLIVENPLISSKPRKDTYFGEGTLHCIKCHLNDELEGKVDAVFVNAFLSEVQQRYLEQVWGKPIMDPVALIISSFNVHARTKEAKLEIELAALMYKKSRLIRVDGFDGYNFGEEGEESEDDRFYISGEDDEESEDDQFYISGEDDEEAEVDGCYIFGVDGEEAEVDGCYIFGVDGEEAEVDGCYIFGVDGEEAEVTNGRRITERHNTLLAQIEELRQTRASRRRNLDGPYDNYRTSVAVVGYTTAGKSTLVSALSENSHLCNTFGDIYALDNLVLPSLRKVYVRDTVGFVSDLPVQLAYAFHAILEEVVDANLLLHVIDSTDPNLDEHRSTVLQVLQQMGVSDEKLQNMIEVKIEYEEGNTYAEENLNHVGDAEAQNINNPDASSSEQQDNTSDDRQLCEEDDETLACWKHPSEEAIQNQITRNDESRLVHDPDIKVSAITKVGLQELKKLIDKRLLIADEVNRLKNNTVFEKSLLYRKWRPIAATEGRQA